MSIPMLIPSPFPPGVMILTDRHGRPAGCTGDVQTSLAGAGWCCHFTQLLPGSRAGNTASLTALRSDKHEEKKKLAGSYTSGDLGNVKS